MRAELMAVVDELKRRRADGEYQVYVADETLRLLRDRVDALAHGRGEEVGAQGAKPAPGVTEAEVMKTFSTPPVFEEASSKSSPKETPSANASLPPPPQFEVPQGSKTERLAWLRQRVLDCPVCNSHVKEGKKVVFGVGNPNAEIFFCGEAPGADEEIVGEPFVGKAGQLLTKIIQAMGLSREQVYIGNIMNWRPELPTPTGNRPPTAEEMAFCLPYLRAQVEIVKPKVLVALGNTAITGLLGPDPTRRLGKIRGRWQDFEGTPLMPTYHPSYVLRYGSQKTKREIWEDMLAVMEYVGMTISDRQRAYFS